MGRKALAILLFLWLLLDLYGSAYHSPSVNASQALHRREEPYQIQVALYNGSGAWYGGTLAMNKMFEWMDCSVTTIQVEDIINGILESKHFDVLAWPGGDYPAYWEVGQGGKANIQKFIRDGGGYMGICAGAWWACDYMVWMADPNYPPPDYHVEGDQSNLDLFPGVARGPIEEITPFHTGTMARINIVNHDHPITDSMPDHMQILYWGGPHLLPYNGADVTILGTYDATGTPAIVAFEYENGRVFLTGPHPEVEENSDRDGLPPDPGWSDPESEWPLLLKATMWLAHTSFSWDHTFEDTCGRGTTLKINIPHKFFQFITPDRDYEIIKATYMQERGTTFHKDSELILIAWPVNIKLDFCIAWAKDLQTGKCYLLFDKPGME